MAPQVGQVLRDARTERGIELSEVERATKIRVKFLRAMEEDRWEALPAPAYARGFLSAYARFLGLDDQALVDQYRATVEGADRAEPIPPTVLRRGHRRTRPVRRVAVLFGGLLVAVAVGLVITAVLGGSDDGGGDTDKRGEKAAGSVAGKTTRGERSAAVTGTSATAKGSQVSLEVRATATVWVCVIDEEGRTLVNGETLTAGDARGQFESRAFEVTFGNGSVEMKIDGEPAKVPPVAEPLGYLITPSDVSRLDPASQPTCL